MNAKKLLESILRCCGGRRGVWANSHKVLGKLVVLAAPKGGTAVIGTEISGFRQLFLAAWQLCHPAVTISTRANNRSPVLPAYLPNSEVGPGSFSSWETSVRFKVHSGPEADREKEDRDVLEDG